MDSKLYKAGAWLAQGNDNVVLAASCVVQGTKQGFKDFVRGYKAQRLADKAQAKRLPYIVRA